MSTAMFTTHGVERGNEPSGFARRFPGGVFLRFVLCLGLMWTVSSICRADKPTADASEQSRARTQKEPLLTPEEWRRVDRAVERGLRFISKSQLADGSFPTAENGQPGVTSLCVMALGTGPPTREGAVRCSNCPRHRLRAEYPGSPGRLDFPGAFCERPCSVLLFRQLQPRHFRPHVGGSLRHDQRESAGADSGSDYEGAEIHPRSSSARNAIRMTGEGGATSTTLAPTIPICRSPPGR